MRYRHSVLAFLLCITLGWNIGLAAGAYYQHLPVVMGAPVQPVTAQIYACQCGAAIASVLPDGRVLVTIQDHSRGGASIVGIDDGVTFRELDNAGQEIAVHTARSLAPSFDFPGQKQGVGSSVYAWGHLIIYAPSRTEVGGTYNILRYVYPDSVLTPVPPAKVDHTTPAPVPSSVP